MNLHEDFNKWCDLWDKASADMEKEAPAKKSNHLNNNNSFFGMNSADDYALDRINGGDASHWKDVLDRTDALYAPVSSELLTEEEEAKEKSKPKREKKKPKKGKPDKDKKNQAEDPEYDEDEDGFGAILAKAIGDEDQFVSPNPIHFASVGTDQKLRVTPNWTSGESLAALAKLKAMMYDLECELLTREALGSDVSGLEKRLESMQKQVHKMSGLLTPDVKHDVS